MIEGKILHAIITENKELALKVFNENTDECSKILLQSRLKNIFFRLVSENKSNNFEGINEYLEKQQIKQIIQLKTAATLSRDFRNIGLNHVFFKGLSLSKYYFKSTVDRYFSDLDLLIDLDDLNKFYDYLDTKNIKHNNNIDYINNLGFTGNALEVLDFEGITLDVHHRISSKLKSKKCVISSHLLKNVDRTKEINITTPELELIINLHHAFKQDNQNLDPYYVLDFYKINIAVTDKLKLEELLKETGLTKEYNYLNDLINNILVMDFTRRKVKKLFHPPKKIKLNFDKTIAQLYQLLDPEPYINMVSGKPKRNYFDFFRLKLKRLLLKINR